MPELPEVETVLRGLRARVLGRRIVEVEVSNASVVVGRPGAFVKALVGRCISGFYRKGKALAIELRALAGQPQFLVVRLGMTGQMTVAEAAEPIEPHTHVRFALDDGREEMRYRDVRRFGRLRTATRQELEAILGRLGPDAPTVSEESFFSSMQGRHGSIKGWLLNQQMLAGLGNIYADEALFEAGIHPLAQAGRIAPDKRRRLLRAVKKVLDRAIRMQGTSFRDYIDIEGRPGNFLPQLKVYQRTGEPCRRCQRKIRRVIVSGRSSHFCPGCQPRPKHVAGNRRQETEVRSRESE